MAALSNSLVLRRPRWKPEALLAAAWCLPSAALAGFLSVRASVWTPPPAALLLMGSPALLLLGRVLLWGWTFAALLENTSLILLGALGLASDLLLLDAGGVAFLLNSRFFLTEIFAIAICLIPAQLFARSTRERRYLAARNLMHFIFHSALLLAIWPLLILQFCGGNWHVWAERSSAANKLYLQLLFLPCVLLVTAMQEFHSRGGGTPMPNDAPRNLVTTGVFSYVANPMQIGKFGVLFGWGLFLKNPFVVAAALLGLLYSASIARWKEDRDLTARFGTAWTNYHRNVRRWLPRWRPWIEAASDHEVAALYLDLDCGPCGHLGTWFAAQRLSGLRILPLKAHPSQSLSRITYRFAGGTHEICGTDAIARSLEHLHLAWAFCGWMLRLPVIVWAAELIANAVCPRPVQCQIASQHLTVDLSSREGST
jgi:protein-S-isoprenylcysteine O-methyltransferase Ste14